MVRTVGDVHRSVRSKDEPAQVALGQFPSPVKHLRIDGYLGYRAGTRAGMVRTVQGLPTFLRHRVGRNVLDGLVWGVVQLRQSQGDCGW